MLRSMRATIALIMVSSFCMTASNAADKVPILCGMKQKKRLENGYDYIQSDAEWRSHGNKGNFLALRASKSAIAKGSSGPVVAAAAVLDFQRGTQVDYLSFTYHKHKEGVFFNDTTDPIVRVSYTTADDRNKTKYKTLNWPINSAGFTWDKAKLTQQGLPPETTFINAVAVVAKPKVNNFVDDYANLEVEYIKYHEALKKDQNIQSPDIDTRIRCDGEGSAQPTNELLTGA